MTQSRAELKGTLVLGRYRIVQALARGGMGVVYLARTEGAAGFTRPVVVKRIIPDLAEDEATGQSFVREARILANLQHPGIVNVIDFDQEDGAYVMVLEYVHGFNVGQWHRYVLDARGQMPVDHALYIVTRVLDALHYAHTFVKSDGTKMSIVHRDVSPGNILVDTQGHVKLLDFGIARANEGGEYKTRDGMFKGKLSYSAPEVYDGRQASPVSDVYSAAVVLYQLLAGENPFKGKDVAEIVRRVLIETPKPLSSIRKDISPELDAAVRAGLSKDPALRPATAAAFAELLRSVRPHRDEEFLSELVDEVWNDFNGEMPVKLGLEPLQSRDAAWRAATAEVPADPITGPPSLARLSGKTPLIPPMTSDSTTLIGREPQMRARAPWPFVAGASVAIIAGLAVFLVMRKPDAPAQGSRFVVVEKQARDDAPENAVLPAADPAPGASASSSAVPASAPASASEVPVIAHPADTAKPRGGGDAAALSRTVQKHRGRIESCFLSHVKEVDGRPEVAVRFRVGVSGKVDSAELSPAALSPTPLGQCLLGVARSVEFGALPDPLSFTIPITARRVK